MDKNKKSIIEVEGYKAFRGTMLIKPRSSTFPPFTVTGDWLYKPECKCWYNSQSSYPEDICSIEEVE